MKSEIIKSITTNPELQIALMALIVSVFSIALGFWSIIITRNHNRKSVKPIGVIDLIDKLEISSIRFHNNGTGPLIIKKVLTRNKHENRGYPVEFMPTGVYINHFRVALEQNAILPGEYLTLLEIKDDDPDDIYLTNANNVKGILKDLEMEIIYEDIYNKKYMIHEKLEWFGRRQDNKIKF